MGFAEHFGHILFWQTRKIVHLLRSLARDGGSKPDLTKKENNLGIQQRFFPHPPSSSHLSIDDRNWAFNLKDMRNSKFWGR